MEQQHVQVFGRVRPLNSRELSKGGIKTCASVCSISDQSSTDEPTVQNTVILDGSPECRTFTFDAVLGPEDSQENVFEVVAKDLVEEVIQGFNGTIFAYGQTGSGKTFTILGPDVQEIAAAIENPVNNKLSLPESRGLLPRALDLLFENLRKEQEASDGSFSYKCKCSFLEIYNERIMDLLDTSNTGLQLRESMKQGVYVERLTECNVASAAEALSFMVAGHTNRTTASTEMNQESSRSHCVFTVVVETRQVSEGMTRARTAKFNLIDLAGSERQSSTGATNMTLVEAQHINTSLSTLGRVISALADQAQGRTRHVHYRDSKLTFLLRDSLGGNSKTHMIANISPSSDCFGESLSTLKFAQRAKLIKNSVKVNEDTSGTVMVLRGEIQRLRKLLQEERQGEISRRLSSSLPSGVDDARIVELEELLRVMAQDGSTFLTREQLLQDQSSAFQQRCVALEKTLMSQRTVVKFRDSTIQRLKNKISQKENTETTTCSECSTLEQELATVRQMIDCHPDVVKLRTKLEEANRIFNLSKEISESGEGQKLTSLKTLLGYDSNLRQVNEGLSEQIEKLLAEKQRIRNGEEDPELIELRTKVSNLESTLLEEKSRADDLDTSVGELQMEISIAKAEKSQVEIENQELRQKCSLLGQFREFQQQLLQEADGSYVVDQSEAHEEVLSKLKFAVETLRKQGIDREEQLHAEIKSQQSQLMELRTSLVDAEKVADEAQTQLSSQITEITEKCSRLQDDLRTANNQNREIKDELESKLSAREEEIEGFKETLNATKVELEAKLHKASSDIEESNVRILSLETDLSTARETCAERDSRLSGMEVMQDELQNMVEMYQAKEKTEQLRILTLQKELEESHSKATELENTCQGLNVQLVSCQEQITDQQESIEQQAAKLQTLESEITVLDKNSKDLEEENNLLKTEFETNKERLNEEIDSLKARILESEHKVVELTAENATIQSQLREERTRFQEELDGSTTKLDEAMAKNMELTELLEEARTKLTTVEDCLGEKVNEIDQLEKESQELNATNNELNERINTVTEELTAKEETLKGLRDDYKVLQELQVAEKQERLELVAKLKQTQGELDSVTETCSQATKESEALSERIKLEQESNQELENTLNDCRSALDALKLEHQSEKASLEESLKKYREESESLENQLKALNEDLLSLQSSYEDVNAKYGELECDLELKSNDLENKNNELTGLNSEVQNLSLKLEETGNELHEKIQECDEIQTKASQLEIQLQEMASEKKDSLDKIDELTKDLSESKEEVATLEAAKNTLTDQHQVTLEKLDEMTVSFEETSSTLEELSTQHKRTSEELDELKEKHMLLETKQVELTSELSEEKQKLVICEEKLSHQNSKYGELNVKHAATLEELELKLNELQESSESLVELQEAYATLQSERTKLENEVIAKSKEASEAAGELAELASQLDMAKSEALGYKRDVTMFKREARKLDASLQATTSQLAQSEESYQKLNLVLEQESLARNNLEENCTRLDRELDVAREKLLSMKKSIEVNVGAKRAAEAAKSYAEGRNEELQEELEATKQRLGDMISREGALEEKVASLLLEAGSQTELKGKIEVLEGKLAQKIQELEIAEKEVSKRDDARKLAESRMREVENELVDAKLDTYSRVGHTNPAQRIKHVINLKEQVKEHKEREEAMRKSLDALRAKLTAQKVSSPSRTMTKEKENKEPLRRVTRSAKPFVPESPAVLTRAALRRKAAENKSVDQKDENGPSRRMGLRTRNANVSSD